MNKWKTSVAALLIAPTIGPGCFETMGCIARGTFVRTPTGRRRIEEIEVGDTILSVDPETGELVEGTVTATDAVARECVALAVGDEKALRCTSDHPVYDPTADTYAPAGDWAQGKRSALTVVTEEDVETVELTDADTYAGVHEVFDLTTDTDHANFVAAGVLVHNKEPVEPPDGYAAADTADAGSTDAPSDDAEADTGENADGTSEDAVDASGE
ncbi:MAG: Hint domain-containing protein [Bradymonadaceae bacterium]